MLEDPWGCPVPTTERREVLLDALREIPDLDYACDRAGISRASLRVMRHRDPSFAAAIRAAWEEGLNEAAAPIVKRLLDYARDGHTVTTTAYGRPVEVHQWDPRVALEILGRVDPRFAARPLIEIDNRTQAVAFFGDLHRAVREEAERLDGGE